METNNNYGTTTDREHWLTSSITVDDHPGYTQNLNLILDV